MASDTTTSRTTEAGKLADITKKFMKPLFYAAWDFQVEGLDNIPKSGGAILTPNHTSVLDSFVVPAVLDRRIFYIGKAEYLDDWKTRKLFPALGMIPIDRSGGEAAQAALDTAARIIESGHLFGIYPEGTRARSGDLHRGHTGPARLALRTGAPLIPVGILGTRKVQPPDQAAPKPGGDITIRFGKPIDVTRYRHLDSDRRVLRQITDELMFEIRSLTGQRYHDIYASKANALIAEGRDINDLDLAAPAPAPAPERERVVATLPKSTVDAELAPIGAPATSTADAAATPGADDTVRADKSDQDQADPTETPSRHRHSPRRGPRMPVDEHGATLEPRRSSAEVLAAKPVELVPIG